MDAGSDEPELLINGGAVRVKLKRILANVEQVCPLRNDRLVVFAGTAVQIVDAKAGRVIDEFGTYGALISPNQRWIIYTKFFFRNTELPASDVYVLYDLSKSPAENHVPARSPQFSEGVGKAIYPVGWKNEDGDNIGLPESQRHYLASKLYWAPDSDMIAFGDRVMGRLSVVVIKIEDSGTTTAFVYPVSGPVKCGQGISPSEGSEWSLVDKIEFGPLQDSDRVLFVDIKDSPQGGCASKSLQLHLNEFEPAKSEVPLIPRPTRGSVVDGEVYPR